MSTTEPDQSPAASGRPSPSVSPSSDLASSGSVVSDLASSDLASSDLASSDSPSSGSVAVGLASPAPSVSSSVSSSVSPALRRGGTAVRRRRTSLRRWLPDQPGAVVMALFPALAGVLLAAVMAGTWPQGTRFHADGVWLLACWALCYGVQFTASRWLRSHGARRYLPPTLVYGVALAAVGLPFVVTHPAILGWAPVYLALAAAVFVAAWLRRERSLWGNAVAVTASSLMALLAFSWSIEPPETPNPLASLTVPGLLLSVWFAAEQFGSVLFVKTMIRERGHVGYLAASWTWHAALFAVACRSALADTSGARMWPVVAVAAVLLVRAVVLPLVARRRRLKPLVPGVTECVTSLLTLAAPLLTV